MLTVLSSLLAACVSPPENEDTLFQTSTLDALAAGSYQGNMTVGELKQHGDFGLGTFNALDGEMVVADGEVYRIDDQGVVHVADDAITTPFAAVTTFKAEETLELPAASTCTAFQTYLDAHLPSLDVPYAIRVNGNFAALTVRSVPAQQEPYPLLADALTGQVVFEQQNLSGSLIGFRLPDYLDGTNVTGYHFHFISTDRQVGGHVLDCTLTTATAAVDALNHLQVDLLPPQALPVAAASTSESPTTAEPIVLGALYNLTGAQAELDIPSAQGAQLAVNEANTAGGVLERQVELVVEDGQTDPSILAEKTAAILAQHPDVTAFLGLSDSDMVLGAAPAAAEAQRPFLTSGATSPMLPEQVPHYLFLACFGDNVQAAAAAEWAYNALSARTAAILYNSTMEYTQGLQAYFAARFAELGGDIVATQSYTMADDTLAQAVTRLTEADVIFVAAGPEDAPEAARLLRQAGFTAPIVGGDGFDSDVLWQQYAEIDDVYFTTHAYLGADNPNPTIQAFRNAYLAQYPDAEPNAFAALGYDAARLLMVAIEQAGSAAPGDVVAALSNVQAFEGVTGRISFTPSNPIPVKSVTILAIESGSYRYVTEVTPQSVPAPKL